MTEVDWILRPPSHGEGPEPSWLQCRTDPSVEEGGAVSKLPRRTIFAACIMISLSVASCAPSSETLGLDGRVPSRFAGHSGAELRVESGAAHSPRAGAGCTQLGLSLEYRFSSPRGTRSTESNPPGGGPSDARCTSRSPWGDVRWSRRAVGVRGVLYRSAPLAPPSGEDQLASGPTILRQGFDYDRCQSAGKRGLRANGSSTSPTLCVGVGVHLEQTHGGRQVPFRRWSVGLLVSWPPVELDLEVTIHSPCAAQRRSRQDRELTSEVDQRLGEVRANDGL